MLLVYSKSMKPVSEGDLVHVDGDAYFVEQIIKPHKPSSTGRVYCTSMCERKYFAQWFPSVIGAEWIDREDHTW